MRRVPPKVNTPHPFFDPPPVLARRGIPLHCFVSPWGEGVWHYYIITILSTFNHTPHQLHTTIHLHIINNQHLHLSILTGNSTPVTYIIILSMTVILTVPFTLSGHPCLYYYQVAHPCLHYLIYPCTVL